MAKRIDERKEEIQKENNKKKCADGAEITTQKAIENTCKRHLDIVFRVWIESMAHQQQEQP